MRLLHRRRKRVEAAVRPVQQRLRQQQILGTGFDPVRRSVSARTYSGRQTTRRRQMDHRRFTAGFTCERGCARDGNLFGVVGSLQSQEAHTRLARGEIPRLEMFQDLVIFGMDQRHTAQPGDLAHRLQQKPEVRVEAKGTVGQEELEDRTPRATIGSISASVASVAVVSAAWKAKSMVESCCASASRSWAAASAEPPLG